MNESSENCDNFFKYKIFISKYIFMKTFWCKVSNANDVWIIFNLDKFKLKNFYQFYVWTIINPCTS